MPRIDIDIREMQALDIPEVINILKITQLFYKEDDIPSKFVEKLRLDGDLMLVAVCENEPGRPDKGDNVAGFVMASYDGWVAVVWHLCILPEYRSSDTFKKLRDAVVNA